MALLFIDDDTRIEVTDDLLDRIADFLENPPTPGGGFWLAGPLITERDGEVIHTDPAEGHQRMWVSSSRLISLIYDRPLHPDPDRVVELPGTIYLP